MKRILVDANVVLDVLLDRRPFVDDASRLWQASDSGVFDGCVAAFTFPTIYYVCRRHAGAAAAERAVDLLLRAFEIAPLYRECIVAARRTSGSDFEDDLQITTAITDFAQGIVTRNPTDFAASPIRVFSPAELLRELGF